MPYPLHHILLAADTGDQTRIADDPPLTRQTFARQCLQLAAALQARGIQRAALWFEDAAAFSTALLACWRAGVTAVLAADPQAHSHTVLSDQVDVWLTDTDLPHTPFAQQWRTTAADAGLAGAALPACALNPNAYLILYTSGSSGKPKPIRKHWWQLLREVETLEQQWPLAADRVHCVLGSVSMQHMYGLPFRVLWPLAAGVPFARAQHTYPQALLHASQAYAHCVWISSPALLQRLGDDLNWAALRGRVARVYCAGGVLASHVSDMLAQRLGLRPTEIYGSSETGVIAWRSGAQQDWQPFPAVSVQLNDQGALHVQAPWVQAQDGQTADAARLNHSGFTLLGRVDRIVKIEDKRIALPLLEHALMQSPLVAHAHVGAVSVRSSRVTRLAALLALSPAGLHLLRQAGRMALIQAVRAPLAQQFEALAVPRLWRFFEQLPVNPQGKITQTRLQHAVNCRPHAPEVHALNDASTPQHERRYTVRIPYDLVYFSGHFPRAPVVPGVAQVGWVWSLAQRELLSHAGTSYHFGGMQALKFQRLMRPGDTLCLSLHVDRDKDKLYFAFTHDGQPCSSGRIVLRQTETSSHEPTQSHRPDPGL